MSGSQLPMGGQAWRFLVVGILNTAFGYATYAALTALLDKVIPHSYLAAYLLAILFNATVSFLGYKWFVFRTQGNYIREWLRCLGVYSGSTLLALVALPGMVFAIRSQSGYQEAAPYVAGALLTAVTAVLSFFGHRHISFRPGTAQPDRQG